MSDQLERVTEQQRSTSEQKQKNTSAFLCFFLSEQVGHKPPLKLTLTLTSPCCRGSCGLAAGPLVCSDQSVSFTWSTLTCVLLRSPHRHLQVLVTNTDPTHPSGRGAGLITDISIWRHLTLALLKRTEPNVKHY